MASLEAVGARGQWVAIPPNTCPNVIAAVIGANCQPWFVDVESARQGIDPARLRDVISHVGAVIAIHSYGTPCRIDEITTVARQAGVPVIEDCAQADGATFAGHEVGTFGDIAVFSFGTGKIVDAGGGGLAVVREARWRSSMQSVIVDWESSSDQAPGHQLGAAYRGFYNAYFPERTALARESLFGLLQALAPSFRRRCNPERIPGLIAERNRRESLVTARREKYRVYSRLLASVDQISAVPLLDGAAPWRFNALVDVKARNSLFRRLLSSNINASTWYPRITEFLPERAFRSTALPVATHFEKTLLNLWIDAAISVQDIEQICHKVKDTRLGWQTA
jgi:dTDP-4-amino-4,6-dideoxygalactose transaminase